MPSNKTFNRERLLCVLTSKQADIYERRETVTIGDYLEYVVCLICKRVGDRMKAGETMLLPSVYKKFKREIYANTAPFSHNVHVQVCEGDIPNAHWLLSHLHLYFENMLEVQCRHRQYSTLLYHRICVVVGIHKIKTSNTLRSGIKRTLKLPI